MKIQSQIEGDSVRLRVELEPHEIPRVKSTITKSALGQRSAVVKTTDGDIVFCEPLERLMEYPPEPHANDHSR